MQENGLKISPRVIRFGFWSALLIAVTFIVFTLAFVGIATNPPLFRWTTLADYVDYVNNNNQFFQSLARLMMLIFASLYVVLLNSIYEYATGDRKFLARVSICFGLAFAILVSVNYFVQLTAVRLNIVQGTTEGLEHFLQANPISVMSSINLLGWTLFLGLSSLCAAPIFSSGRLERVISIAFALNGIVCLVGGIGYAIQSEGLVFLTLNFGLGGAILIASIALCVWFRRMGKQVAASTPE